MEGREVKRDIASTYHAYQTEEQMDIDADNLLAVCRKTVKNNHLSNHLLFFGRGGIEPDQLIAKM